MKKRLFVFGIAVFCLSPLYAYALFESDKELCLYVAPGYFEKNDSLAFEIGCQFNTLQGMLGMGINRSFFNQDYVNTAYIQLNPLPVFAVIVGFLSLFTGNGSYGRDYDSMVQSLYFLDLRFGVGLSYLYSENNWRLTYPMACDFILPLGIFFKDEENSFLKFGIDLTYITNSALCHFSLGFSYNFDGKKSLPYISSYSSYLGLKTRSADDSDQDSVPTFSRERSILNAIETGNINQIGWLLRSGMEVNAEIDHKKLLQFAYEKRNHSSFQYLLHYGANPNLVASNRDFMRILAEDTDGYYLKTALFYGGYLKPLSQPEIQGDGSVSVKKEIILSNDLILKELTSGEYFMYEAIGKQDTNQIESLLRQGVDVNIRKAHREGFITFLQYAYVLKKKEIFEYLLKKGANPNVNLLDEPRSPFLFQLLNDTDVFYFQEAIKHGGNPDCSGEIAGRNFLFDAIEKNDYTRVCLIVNAGADLNFVFPGMEKTPLLYACELGRYDVAILLVQKGSNLDLYRDELKRTLYHKIYYNDQINDGEQDLSSAIRRAEPDLRRLLKLLKTKGLIIN